MKTFKYKAYKSLKAGSNSSYSIIRSDGKTSSYGFDSMCEAKSYIEDRMLKGQDPLTMHIDESKMIEYLLNN